MEVDNKVSITNDLHLTQRTIKADYKVLLITNNLHLTQ